MHAPSRPFAALFVLSAALAAACTDATDVTLLEVDATAAVTGVVYQDNDGDGLRTGIDQVREGLTVVLLAGGGVEVRDAVSDSLGRFVFLEVPTGAYTLRIPERTLGDSLDATPEAAEALSLSRGDTARIDLGITYPSVPVEEVSGLAPGTRVFTSGIALNARLPFGDGRVHVRGASGALRAVDVERVSLATGDSVRLLGRTAVDGGRTVLGDVTAFVLVSQAAIPAADDLSTGAAASAGGGAFDAALVRVRDAAILDTATVNEDLHVTIDDGSGPIEMVLRSYLSFDTRTLQPDTVFAVARATGLLVPAEAAGGTVRWRLFPRGSADLATEVRRTDVAVTKAVDPGAGSEGDVLTFTIVVRNPSVRSASAVEVVDSLPAGFARLDAETTRGGFDGATGRWTVGDLAPGAADTLTVRARIDTTVRGVYVSRARVVPLTRELDTDPSNDAALVNVEVVAPAAPPPSLRRP